MFDIGYSELFLTAIVALIVLGPEKLPGAMRTTGLWVGRIRRSFDRIKQELEAEVGMDEIRRQIHNDGILEEARRLKRDLNDAVQSTHEVWQEAQSNVTSDLMATPSQTPATVSPTLPSAPAHAAGSPSREVAAMHSATSAHASEVTADEVAALRDASSEPAVPSDTTPTASHIDVVTSANINNASTR